MSLTDYIIDIALIAVVVRQVQGRRLTVRSLLLPLVLVTWVAASYLKGIPTAGNDLVLVVGGAALGGLLGALCGLFTSVEADRSGTPVAKAGAVAAALWILGVGTRFAFQLYATHGGAASIGRFSVTHGITGGEAWTAALVLMAVFEVALRTGVLAWRGTAVRRRPAPRPLFAGSSLSAGGEHHG